MKSIVRQCAVLSSAGLLISSLAFSQQQAQPTAQSPRPTRAAAPSPAQAQPQGETATTAATTQAPVEFQANLQSGNQLIGMPVHNAEGQQLGFIEDIVLDGARQRISYAVLSFGQVDGVEDQLFAVPWAYLQAQEQPAADAGQAATRRFITNLDQAALAQAPSFSRQERPDVSQPEWDREVRQYYAGLASGAPAKAPAPATAGEREATDTTETAQTRAAAEEAAPSPADAAERTPAEAAATAGAADWAEDENSFWTRRLTQLIGTNVRAPQQRGIGEIEDIAIEMREGRPVYGVISLNGVEGLQGRLAVVPWRSLEINPQRHVAHISIGTETLSELSFTPAEFPDLGEMEFARRLYETLDREPYWTVYGYAEPEAPQDLGEAWQPGSAYNQQFDPGTLNTVRGQIVSVGTFRPDATAADGLRLRVLTSDGRTVTIHAGPRKFIDQHGLLLHQGDTVEVTGSELVSDGRRIIMATQIKKDEQPVDLRTREGEPRWTAQGEISPLDQPDVAAEGEAGAGAEAAGAGTETGPAGQAGAAAEGRAERTGEAAPTGQAAGSRRTDAPAGATEASPERERPASDRY